MIDTDVGYCWSETKRGHTHTSKPFCSDDTFYGHYSEGKCNVLELIATGSPGWTDFLTEVNYVTKVVWRGSIFSNPEGPIGTTGTTSGNGNGNLFLQLVAFVFQVIGDAFQMGMDSVTSDSNTINYNKLTYTRSEIEDNQELNEKIDVKDAEEPEDFLEQTDAKIIKYANISDEADDKFGNPEKIYTESTEIPVIPIDVYSTFTEKINLFDINFFSTSNTNSNAKWNLLKRIVLGITHVTLYMSAALLITMLIIRSIIFVRTTLGGKPNEAAKSKNIMDAWTKAIVLIIAVFVIMPILIYLEQDIENIVLNGNNSRYYIRANVENVYQFNTNFIGFVKYMSLTSNVGAKVGFSILYAAIAFINFVWTGALFVRALIIAGLTIIAPFTAINAMIAKDTANNLFARIIAFKNWIRLYITWTYVPLAMLIILKIIISIIV